MPRLKFVGLCCLFLAFTAGLPAQAFVNGSFEVNTAAAGCNYNLSNATFNSRISGMNGYGPGNELDILRPACYNPGFPDGTFGVGLAAAPEDELALDLVAPLTAGVTYTISFWTYAEMSFRPLGNLEVGASTSNAAFGTQIYIANTVPSTWVNHVFSFVAPNNTTHITLRNMPGGPFWNHVDDFEFVVTLPVDLTYFEVQQGKAEVLLNWSTGDTEYAEFVVERSPDQLKWETVETILADGQKTADFHHTDEAPLPGASYYRIRMADGNGMYALSEVRSVSFESAKELRCYPNPATSRLIVEGTGLTSDQIELYDMTGRSLRAGIRVISAGAESIELDVSGLASGIYLIRTAAGSGRFRKD